MKIITTPNPILITKSKPVKKFDRKLKNIIIDMEKTLIATVDPVGVGLAAPQVGLSFRLFLTKPSDQSPTSIYINPVIKHESKDEAVLKFSNSKKIEANKPKSSKKKLLEGCLSLPNIWGNVSRKKELTLAWQDEDGTFHTKHFKGFPAVIIQHEMDHLNGILFTKHVMEQKEQLYRSHKNKKGEDVFDEIEI
ncbi:MAG: peptide deformylase [Candidatus Levybacteria bacterium CG_4_10_14_0_2_um_filter_36_16]|nr:MAG: peptide deformylase [Candidatus Levybacteria bacterium CG2_30_37_29]PIR79508.1 MAG: peptide deformylase [Candidatus Levybacteria bacterium CG10_big_fil_rev_8_21_14_0_10_36_30]PIZ96707.1 MAG: peptide deformylase [Candidatus Levybacteria bacterium CG_4_10_14_0_2_um_filter_36_16]PJA90295.1 MAG: peptide deformylase [Candidatus Levybacteria bacterium CG_4_9_14_3_um_filter_36_7]